MWRRGRGLSAGTVRHRHAAAHLGDHLLAQALDRPEAAAHLLGAEHAFIAHTGYDGFGGVMPSREHLRRELQAEVGEAHFARLWESGRQLSVAEAITEALALAEEMAGAG